MPTPITNIRLTESDRAVLDVIRRHYGIKTVAEAIRKAIETQRQVMEAESGTIQKVARSNRKKSGVGP